MTALNPRFAINTYSYTQSMKAADCLHHLADMGAQAFELMFYPGHLWIGDGKETWRTIRQVLSGRHLDLVSMNGPNIDLNIAAAAEEMRAMSIDLNKNYLRIAGELGAKGLILGPGKPNPLFPLAVEAMEGHFFAALDILLPVAERTGVELWVENMPFAFLPDAPALMASLDRYGSDRLKVCYDVANAHYIGEDPVAGLKAVASRLALVHVSDTTQNAYRHDAVGDGDLDFSALPQALVAVSYEKPVMLEVISRHADDDIASSVSALQDRGFGN